MLFNYNDYVDELKENDNVEKREVAEKYIRYYGPQDDVDIHDTVFYKNYLAKYDIPFELVKPEDCEDDFDWDLLGKLILGSYSSVYELVAEKDNYNKEKQGEKPRVRIYITVKSGDKKITKEISELWCFQIIRLYEIYIEEQMNMHSLMAEEKEAEEKAKEKGEEYESEEEAIKEEQKTHLLLFQHKIKRIMKQPGLLQELEELL